MQGDSEPRDNDYLDRLIADVRRVAGGADEGLHAHLRTRSRDDAETDPRPGIDRIFRTLTGSPQSR